MKKLVLALSAVAAFSAPALAADMAAKAPLRAAPVAVYNWTGCYVGAGFGYGMSNADHDQIATGTANIGTSFPLGTLTATNQTAGGRGWTGNVGAGCDYQFGGGGFWGSGLLIGAFADYQWSRIRGQTDTFGSVFFQDGSAETGVGTLNLSGTWAVGGRVGWVVVPQLLTYFTGGYTEAKFDGVSFSGKLLGPLQGAATGLSLPGQTYQGWFLGGGTEYALGWLPGLFLKTEYRYSTYNSKTIGTNCLGLAAPNLFCATTGPSGFSDRYKPQVQTIFTELVYRFNWGAPVAAKY